MEKKKHQMWGMVIGVVAILLAVSCIGIAMLQSKSNLKSNEETNEESYERKQYKSFVADLDEYIDNLDPQMDYSEAKMDVISKVIELEKTYKDGSGVEYVANKLINGTMSVTYASTKDYINALSFDLGSLLGGLFGGSSGSADKVLTMRSNTVCDGGKVTDSSKYCIDNLSANVYITDKKSSKWAVLVHANNLTGQKMYDALGAMYTSQGYNVLAPDLRGFGNSGGSNAMGYLESLDVYDWIKYLNEKPSEFGVTVAPKNIIVHGVSLGGATTLQLATNPDIAGKVGGTYNKTLTDLNVKGFVDDCGYTSMTGIIKGMLSSGDSDVLSTVSGYLGVDENAFPNAIQEAAGKLGITGLGDIDFSKITNGKDLSSYFNQFSDAFNSITGSSSIGNGSIGNGTIGSGSIGSGTIGNGTIGSGSIGSGSTGQSGIPGLSQGGSNNSWWNQSGTGTSATGSARVTLVENLLDGDLGDKLIRMALMSLLNTGLDDSNFDKYQNSFSSGRSFPSGAKVMIIHGTSDTIVNHNNAETVASNIGSANLFYKWDVEGAPHAFIVIGSEKDKYTNLVGSFTKYVETGEKNEDVFASGSSSGGSSSGSGSSIFDKIASFFSGLFGKK